MTGIYCIKNQINNKIYIGSAKNFKKRWGQHRSNLKWGRHHNIYLQRSHDKHGVENFTYEVLEECDAELLFEREQHWIDELAPDFNLGGVGGGDNLSNHPNLKEIIKRRTQTFKENYQNMTPTERARRWDSRRGSGNGNWKGGISDERPFCLDCGVELGGYYARRCPTCAKLGNRNPFAGKKHTDKMKKKASERMKGVYKGNQRKRIKIGDTTYESCADAARALGVSNGLITYRLKHETKYQDYVTLPPEP